MSVLSTEGQASVNKKTELSCDSKRVRTCYRQEDRKIEEEDEAAAPVLDQQLKSLHTGNKNLVHHRQGYQWLSCGEGWLSLDGGCLLPEQALTTGSRQQALWEGRPHRVP